MLIYIVQRTSSLASTREVLMFKSLSIATIALLSLVTSFGAQAQVYTNWPICQAGGIGSGNIANYKERYFDENPQETMLILQAAKKELPNIPKFERRNVSMDVINAASANSWPTVLAALREFNKVCPCGGQSPCGTVTTNPVKVN